MIGLHLDMILNCFLSSLFADIRCKIVMLQPMSISQAIGIAKLVEDKIKDSKPRTCNFYNGSASYTTPFHKPITHPNPPPTNQPLTSQLRNWLMHKCKNAGRKAFATIAMINLLQDTNASMVIAYLCLWTTHTLLNLFPYK